MKRHTQKKIPWNNETWTLIRAKGRSKYLEKDSDGIAALAQLHPDEKIIAFKASSPEIEIKYIIHEMIHYVTDIDDSEKGEIQVWHITNEIIDFLIANNINLSLLTKGFE